MAELAGSIAETLQPIESDQVRILGKRPAEYEDAAVLTMVLEDARRAFGYLTESGRHEEWADAAILFQSPRGKRTFENTTVARANVSRFRVAQTVQSLVPGMQGGIFYETPPFTFRPRPNQKEATVRAKTALYAELLDRCGFELQAKKSMESQVLYGTTVCKGGWEVKKRVRKEYVRKRPAIQVQLPLEQQPRALATEEADEVEIKEVEEEVNAPFFEVCKLGSVAPDPGWTDANELHKAKYVIERKYVSWKELEELRENELYDIPSEEALRQWFFGGGASAGGVDQAQDDLNLSNTQFEHAALPNEQTSADPLDQTIEMLERWDPEQCHVVLRTANGRAVIIRTGDHMLPQICYFSANYWNTPESGWGLGVGRIVGSDQQIEKGLTNGALDIVSLAINPQYARDTGANVMTQQIRQRLGGIVDVQVRGNQSVRDVFGIIETPKVPGEAFALLQNAVQTANTAAGADEAFTQGSLPGRGGSSAARTATGAGGIISANAGRIQGPVGHWVDGILLPFMGMLEAMVKQFMPTSEIRRVLGDQLGDYELDMEDFFNATERMECLAGAHLAAKKAMAQALPLMIQVLENPHLVQQLNQTGWVVDVKEIFEMFLEVSEWKNSRDLVRPMNPKEQQAMQAANPEAGKMQAAMQQLQAKHVFRGQEIDQEAQNRLAHDLFLNAGDEAANYVERGVARDAERAGVYVAPGTAR